MAVQTVIVVFAVGAAAFYVIRAFLPRKEQPTGCDSCPANRSRKDDYT